MSKHPRVKDVIEAYDIKGIAGVSKYLNNKDLIIDSSTWVGKMKRLLDSKKWFSMEAEIASILFIFKLTPDERERRSDSELSDQGFTDGGDSS